MYSPYQGYYQQQQTPPPAYAQYHQPFAPQLAPQPEYPQQYAHHHQQQGLHQHAQNHHFAPPQPHQYLQDSSCSSSQTAPQAHPPVISSPDIRGAQGVPLHICVASASGGSCVKCLNAAPRNEAVASRRTHRQIPHATLNVAVASGPRAFPRVPRELQSVLGAFDWTIQLGGGGGGGDGEAWLMDGGSVLAKIGPMVNRSVRITKPVDVGRGYNAGMVMTRVDLPGPGYVVDWILQAAPGDQDIGFWAWYRYANGAIRVWNYPTAATARTPPVLVAWKSAPGHARSRHWMLNEDAAGERHGAGQSAAILVVLGIVVFNQLGRALAGPN